MANLNTVNAIGFRYSLFGVSNGGRSKMDAATIGFAATPSCNRQDTILTPATVTPSVAASITTVAVKSFVLIRTSGKVKITVTKGNVSYVQVVDAIFAMSPDEEVSIAIETVESFNTNCIIVWS